MVHLNVYDILIVGDNYLLCNNFHFLCDFFKIELYIDYKLYVYAFLLNYQDKLTHETNGNIQGADGYYQEDRHR